MFVSHCILNENTRYFGGAFTKGSMSEILTVLDEQGIGIVQMKCPEQMAWGGVQKRIIWKALTAKQGSIYTYRKIIMPLFMFYTKYAYRRLARDVVHDIIDYHAADVEVIGLIGVDGSPSCGVLNRLRMGCSLDVMANLNTETMNSANLNHKLYSRCLAEGPGMFIHELKRQLNKIDIPMHLYSIDIVKEMRGKKQSFSILNVPAKRSV